jgi:class 3 adenylate cyclase
LRSAAGPDSEECRPITVILCDLVGSASLAAQLDAEGWRSLVNACPEEASAAVTVLGGHVLKRLGDGLMALFGYPQAQETAERRSIRSRNGRLRFGGPDVPAEKRVAELESALAAGQARSGRARAAARARARRPPHRGARSEARSGGALRRHQLAALTHGFSPTVLFCRFA